MYKRDYIDTMSFSIYNNNNYYYYYFNKKIVKITKNQEYLPLLDEVVRLGYPFILDIGINHRIG